MSTKINKIAVGAIVVFLFGVLFLLFTDSGDKLGRLATINSNIAKNIASGVKGDIRDLNEITVEYVKNNTGSTAIVNEENLPKAFRPMKKIQHPPFEMGACQVCHAPRQKNPAAILTKTVADLCYMCHEPKLAHNEKPKNFDCNKCHSPHHADRKVLLRTKVTERECPVGDFVK